MELMPKSENYTFTKLTETEFLKYQTALLPVVIPLEQSLVWGEFNNSVEGREFLGSFSYSDSSGRFVALASATLYHERGRDWIWIKHGPLFASTPNTNVIKNLCSTLQRQFQSIIGSQPVFIRLSVTQKESPLQLPFEHTMYDETVVVELEKTEDELFAGMSQSGRQGVRKADKAEIKVVEIISDRVSVFTKKCYPILKETSDRNGFGIHPLSLYITMLENLPNNTRLYAALHNKEVEAWAIITEYNGQAMYYYGASSAKARETFATYALHWEIMKTMKEHGNKTYDFMGIAGKNYEALKNVTQFKIKFSKNIVSIPLTFDLPLHPIKYRALTLAIKAKRKLKL